MNMHVDFSPNKMFAVNVSANHVYVHICLCQMYHMSISTYTSYYGHFICKWTDIHAGKWNGCRLHYTWVKRLVSQWLLSRLHFNTCVSFPHYDLVPWFAEKYHYSGDRVVPFACSRDPSSQMHHLPPKHLHLPANEKSCIIDWNSIKSTEHQYSSQTSFYMLALITCYQLSLLTSIKIPLEITNTLHIFS